MNRAVFMKVHPDLVGTVRGKPMLMPHGEALYQSMYGEPKVRTRRQRFGTLRPGQAFSVRVDGVEHTSLRAVADAGTPATDCQWKPIKIIHGPVRRLLETELADMTAAAAVLHNFIGNKHPDMASLPLEVQTALLAVRQATR